MQQNTPYHTPLYRDALAQIGIPTPWAFGLADRTRFGELDALSHVNNTAYLRWLENFRIGYFREYGLSDYQGTPPRLVLKSIGMEFRKEMVLHEDYVVTGRTSAFRTSSFTMDYAVWAGDLRATGQAVIVWLTQDGHKMPIPDPLRTVFVDRDGARDDR
ncbi:MAG: thioesterase family protein [Pseudomonadota bacterium]